MPAGSIRLTGFPPAYPYGARVTDTSGSTLMNWAVEASTQIDQPALAQRVLACETEGRGGRASFPGNRAIWSKRRGPRDFARGVGKEARAPKLIVMQIDRG